MGYVGHGTSQAPLLTFGRGKWDLECEARNYRISCSNRNASTTEHIATLDGIRADTPIIQMTDGTCSIRLETDFNIKRDGYPFHSPDRDILRCRTELNTAGCASVSQADTHLALIYVTYETNWSTGLRTKVT